MSEPVTNVEIEDVLSSIRRLVSNTDREDRVERIEADQGVEKLVLTPSLRVDDEDTSEDIVEVQQVEDAQNSEFEAAGFVFSDGEPETEEECETAANTQEECGNDLPAKSDDADTSTGVDSAVMAGAQPEGEDAISDVEIPTATDDIDQEGSENTEKSKGTDVWLDTGNGPERDENDDDDERGDAEARVDEPSNARDIRNVLQARAASFETVVGERRDQWEPDGPSDDDYAGGKVEPLPWEEHDDSENAGGDASGNTDENPGIAAEEADTVSEEAEVMKADLQATKDEISQSDVAAIAFHSRHAAESVDKIKPADVFEQHDASDAEVLVSDTPLISEEALLDEDALRDMVSDIVRQELQGALGERITRNVRKLVRREIHRALTSQELE